MILPLDFLSDQAVLAATQHYPAQLAARFVFNPPPMKPKDGEREQDPHLKFSSWSQVGYLLYSTNIYLCLCISIFKTIHPLGTVYSWIYICTLTISHQSTRNFQLEACDCLPQRATSFLGLYMGCCRNKLRSGMYQHDSGVFRHYKSRCLSYVSQNLLKGWREFYRKPLYLRVKAMVSGQDFSCNQSIVQRRISWHLLLVLLCAGLMGCFVTRRLWEKHWIWTVLVYIMYNYII